MLLQKTLFCEKYRQEVDIEKNPCPHPVDYCQYRTRCVINMQCTENLECKEKRRKQVENTR
jgi:hypothetical protein